MVFARIPGLLLLQYMGHGLYPLAQSPAGISRLCCELELQSFGESFRFLLGIVEVSNNAHMKDELIKLYYLGMLCYAMLCFKSLGIYLYLYVGH